MRAAIAQLLVKTGMSSIHKPATFSRMSKFLLKELYPSRWVNIGAIGVFGYNCHIWDGQDDRKSHNVENIGFIAKTVSGFNLGLCLL